MQITQAQQLEEKLNKIMSSKGSGEQDAADAAHRQTLSDGRKLIAMQWITIIANMKRVRKMTLAVEFYRAKKRVSETE